MKRFSISMLCLMISSTMLLNACGEKKEPAQQSSAQKSNKLSEPGKFPVSNEKITLSVITPASSNAEGTIQDNKLTKELEEKTNIHIEWQQVETNFKEKVNLMFASGQYADIVLSSVGAVNKMDRTTQSQLGSQGLIIPLNKLIDTQSVWFKQALVENPELKSYITAPDGNIYDMPMINDGYHTENPYKMWINTTWLKNLGLSMPTTTDEFYNMLKAFRDNDPNKNGKKDEIPLSTCKSGANVELDGFLMNAFNYAPGGDRLYIKDGKVTLAASESNYKEGLKYLNKLYSEGLINKDSFTQDQKAQINVNENGEVPVIGAFPSLHLGYALNLTATNKWHEYNSVPPLKGPSGFKTTTYNPYAKFVTGTFSITKDCKNPEAALRLVDWFYSTEGTLRTNWGRENIEWTKADEGQKGITGDAAKYKTIPVDKKNAEYMNVNWGQLFPFNASRKLQYSFAAPQDPYGANVNPMEGRMKVFYDATKEHSKVNPDIKTVLPDLYYAPESIEELNRLKLTINDYLNESIIKFIVGKQDINKDWDSYVNQLDKLGVKNYLKIVQDAYDKQYKK